MSHLKPYIFIAVLPLLLFLLVLRAPNGIRTRVTAVKGRCPRPLDDGDVLRLGNLTREKVCDQMAFMGTKKPLAAGLTG